MILLSRFEKPFRSNTRMTNAVLMVRTRTRCIVVHLRWLELVYTFVPKNGVIQTVFFCNSPSQQVNPQLHFLAKAYQPPVGRLVGKNRQKKTRGRTQKIQMGFTVWGLRGYSVPLCTYLRRGFGDSFFRTFGHLPPPWRSRGEEALETETTYTGEKFLFPIPKQWE